MLEERTVYWAECDECGDCAPEFDTETDALRWWAQTTGRWGSAFSAPNAAAYGTYDAVELLWMLAQRQEAER